MSINTYQMFDLVRSELIPFINSINDATDVHYYLGVVLNKWVSLRDAESVFLKLK